MGRNVGCIHLSPDAEEVRAPPSEKMDAIETQEAQADLFANSNQIYLHCCDVGNCFTVTVPSLPFLTINGLFAHFSFFESPSERRMCIVPLSEPLLRKVEGLKSPAVVNVKSSVIFEVSYLFLFAEAIFSGYEML